MAAGLVQNDRQVVNGDHCHDLATEIKSWTFRPLVIR